jgi:Protein of unknown function (DUF559)
MLVVYSIDMGEVVARARTLRRCMTDAEIILWSRLRDKKMHGRKIRRQHAWPFTRAEPRSSLPRLAKRTGGGAERAPWRSG